jgi:heme O synthase-like polyprenyltransferase
MSGRKTLAGERRRRKLKTFMWISLVTIVTIFLIYKEMTAVLYILATFAVTALLVTVAFADLSHSQTRPDAPDGGNKTT